MDNIRHLTEVLKSQVGLYSELAELMAAEKQSIVSWAVDETVEITKKKEMLLKRERIQEEARNALLSKLSLQYSISDIKLPDVIKIARDKDKEMSDILEQLGNRLMELVTQIHAENLALRVLYATNSKMINEFFLAVGVGDTTGYGPQNVAKKRMPSMHNIVG